MNMRESILKFAEEFTWEPRIENKASLTRKEKTIVAGMGGSPLAADLLNAINPALDLIVHKDYDLPLVSLLTRGAWGVITISYSGNTEETIDAFETAKKEGMPVAVIAKGGKLLDRAKEEAVPYVQLPSVDIQPRMALGFIIKALAALLGLEALAKELTSLADELKPVEFEEPGRALAGRIGDRGPLIYASTRNRAIVYNWKIKFNETAKTPAFYNVFPELNHNEMNALPAGQAGLSSQFYTIILHDPDDHSRIKKRMEVLAELYRNKEIPVEILDLAGESFLERVFSSLLFADWTALALAEMNGIDPNDVPTVEAFKKRITSGV